jgi:hypothetical protein
LTENVFRWKLLSVSFDPSTIASQLAALQARCDYQQFALTVTTGTKLISGQSALNLVGHTSVHPFQGSFPVANPSTAVTIQWSGVYRSNKYTQPPLIVDAGSSLVGQAAVLTAANEFLNLIDLQQSSLGANPNTYATT